MEREGLKIYFYEIDGGVCGVSICGGASGPD